jgi:hypothetical protein
MLGGLKVKIMKRGLIMMTIAGILAFLLGLLVHVFYNDFTMTHVAGTAIVTAIGNFIVGVIISLIDDDM